MNLLEHMPWVRPITDEDRLPLVTAMRADGHTPAIFPTHVFERQGKIVGATSLGTILCFPAWVDSKSVRARESLALLNTVENLARLQGYPAVVMPCNAGSPFYPYLEALGYRKGTAEMFVKVLR